MLVLLSTTLLMVGTRFLWYRLLPLYLRRLGANEAQVGTVFTVVLLLGPLQLVGGYISDRWGRRYAIAIPSLLLVPALIIGALAEHWAWLAAMTWWVAVVSSIQQPGFQALLAESATDEERGRVFGLFYMILALAQMAGPAVGAVLLPVLAVSGLIGLNAIGALVSGSARLFFLREGQFAVSASAPIPTNTTSLLGEYPIRRLIVINSLFLLLLSLTRDGPFVALHAADTLGLGEQAINILFAIGGAGAVLAALLGGGLSDRLGGRQVGAIALIIHTGLLVLWGELGWVNWAGYALFGLSWIAVQIGIVGYSAWLSAYAPAVIRGRVLGLVGAVASLISATGPQIGTWLRNSTFLLPNSAGWATRLQSSTPFMLALLTALALAILILRPTEEKLPPA
jgi:MFS family permease